MASIGKHLVTIDIFLNIYKLPSHAAEGTKSAIDGDDGAGDEGGGVATEPAQCPMQIVRLPEAAHRGVFDDGLPTPGVAAIGVDEQGTVLIGDEEPRRDGIDPDPLPHLLRHLNSHPFR